MCQSRRLYNIRVDLNAQIRIIRHEPFGQPARYLRNFQRVGQPIVEQFRLMASYDLGDLG